MIYIPSMFRSRKASLNLTYKCVIVVQLELHPGKWLVITDYTDVAFLYVLAADGDLGPGDHTQVSPGLARPPAQVRVRGQDAAPHPVIFGPSLQRESNSGRRYKEENNFYLKR